MAPVMAPSRTAGFMRRRRLPTSQPVITGATVTAMPESTREGPTERRVSRMPLPADTPTPAMNIWSPSSMNTQRAADGIRPKVG